MKKVWLIFLLPVFLMAEMKFSNPEPTFDNPRKWIVRINTNNPEIVNHNLDAINNVLKEYPQESLKVAIIFYSKGMRLIKKDGDKKIQSRIKSLQEYGVELVACKNTMDTMKWKESDFIDGLTYAQAGVAEAIERIVAGWIDVTPY